MTNALVDSKETSSLSRTTDSEETIDGCLALVEQLREVLGEEASAISRFDSSKLLQILPLKQCLTEDLGKKLKSWKTAEDAGKQKAPREKYLLLKSRLAEVKRINNSNGVFIGSTLSFYEDFLRCLCPSSYGSCGGQPSSTKFEAPKGLTFRKEI